STAVTVQQQEVSTGAWAARTTSSGGAVPTYAYKQLSSTPSDVYYRLRFKIVTQNLTSVNLMKVRSSTGASILGLYVASDDKLNSRNDAAAITTLSTTTASVGSWHELRLHAVIGGAATG